MKNLLALFVTVIFAMSVSAQTNWQGHINYKITASSSNPQMADAVQSINGSTMDISVKDSLSRTDMNMSVMQTTIIANSVVKNSTMLMDMMGNKYAIKLSADDIKQQTSQAESGYDVKYDDSTKLIAGHLCKKAIVTMKKDKKEFTVWYTSDINAPIINKNMYSKINGLPLEWEMEGGPINMKFTCTLLDTKPVDASIFAIPDGYQTMSYGDFKQSMGQMGGGH